MDPRQFDRLARLVGSGSSRRNVLKSLAGGALGAVAASVGFNQAEAASRKRSVGNSCASNADCASNLCVQESRTRKICHCTGNGDCVAAGDQCHQATCLPTGYCGATVIVNGPCDDGNLCTTGDACQANGTCVGVLKNCDDGNACTTDSCDPATGACVHTAIVCPPGQVCDTVAGCVACIQAADCPATGNECIVPTCIGNVCSTSNLGNSHVLSTGQTSGDCQKIVCDGAGGITSIDDPTDLPTSSTVCLINPTCTGVPLTPSFANAPDGTACDDSNVSTINDVCLTGVCVGCFPDSASCTTGAQCCSHFCGGNVCTTQ